MKFFEKFFKRDPYQNMDYPQIDYRKICKNCKYFNYDEKNNINFCKMRGDHIKDPEKTYCNDFNRIGSLF